MSKNNLLTPDSQQKQTQIIVTPQPNTQQKNKPVHLKRVCLCVAITDYVYNRFNCIRSYCIPSHEKDYNMLSNGQIIELAIDYLSQHTNKHAILSAIESENRDSAHHYRQRTNKTKISVKILPEYLGKIFDLYRGYGVYKTDIINCAVRLLDMDLANNLVVIKSQNEEKENK